MKPLFKIIAFVVLTSLAVSCSCSSSNDEVAESNGSDDARRLIEIAPSLTSMQLERNLLEIRAKEARMRVLGNNEDADRYIAEFENYMRANCDSLSQIIFQ